MSRSYLVENRWICKEVTGDVPCHFDGSGILQDSLTGMTPCQNFQLEFHDRVRLLSILHTFWQSKHDIGKSIFIDDSPDKSRDFQLRGLFSLGWSGS